MSTRPNNEPDPDLLLGDMEMIFDDDDDDDDDHVDDEDNDSGEIENGKDMSNSNRNGENDCKSNPKNGENELPQPQTRNITKSDAGQGATASFGVPGANGKGPPSGVQAASVLASINAEGNKLGDMEGGKIHSWDAEAARKGVRQTMILEIARLLKSRKKTQPSNEWLQQLPHKARKLEERLYRAAPSLTAYQDLSTLKSRLQTVAQMITNQYAVAKSRHSFALGGSKRMSAFSALRNSFSSTLESDTTRRDSIPLESALNFLNDGSSMPGGTPGFANTPAMMSSSSLPDPSSTDTKKSADAGMSRENQLSSSSVISNNSHSGADTPALPYQQPQQQEQNFNAGGNEQDSSNMKMLEQTKALNERLRLQIQENIRRQNEWLRQMQVQQQQQGNMSASGVASSGGNLPQQQQQLQNSQSPRPNMQQLSMLQGGTAAGPGSNPIPAPAQSQYGNMANMTRNMAAMGMANGAQRQGQEQQQQPQQQSGVNIQQSLDMSGGFPFGQSSASAAFMNNPATTARLQALLMQQQQSGFQNTMNMLASRTQQQHSTQQPQQQPNQFVQQQLQQQMGFSLQQSQLPQQSMENMHGGGSNNVSNNPSSNSSMQPHQQAPPATASGGGANLTLPNNVASSDTRNIPSQDTNKDGRVIPPGGTARAPSNAPLSPGSFYW